VCFAGADDIAEPERLARVYAAFRHDSQPDLVVSDVEVIGEDGTVAGRRYGFPWFVDAGNVLLETLKRNYFLGAAMAVRRGPELQLDPRLPAGDDFDLALRMLIRGARWRRIAEPLVRYRVHAGNYSNKHETMVGGAQQALAKRPLAAWRLLLTEAGHAAADVELALGIVALFLDRVEEARTCLARARPLSADTRIEFEYHFYAGVAEFLAGERLASLDHFTRAHALRIEEPTAMNNLGVVEIFAGNEWTRGRNLIEQAMASEPAYLDAQHNAAQCLAGKRSALKLTRRLLPPVVLHGRTYQLRGT
jgi:tetratricopeptide (TPR) repeat protein